MTKPGSIKSAAMRLALVALAAVLFNGCMISDQKSKDSNSEKVEMSSPLGGLKVETDVDPQQVGLRVYPGARLKPAESGDHDKSANVNIQTPFFGLRVIVLDYLSDDSPQQVVAFYKQEMSRYGRVVECQGASHNIQAQPHGEIKLHLDCDDVGQGDSVELKAGQGDSQHIVGVSHLGHGSEFALVYIRVRGQQDDNTI